VQRLPWDFRTSFPQPTDDAIENGTLEESDREPENLKSLHENYATQCLATLAALDKVTQARQMGVDPAIIRFSHSASSSKKVYRSSFIPGLHDTCMIFQVGP
jgi:hypothetical protein